VEFSYVIIIRITTGRNPPCFFLCHCRTKQPCVDSLAANHLSFDAINIVVVSHLHELLNGAVHKDKVTLVQTVRVFFLLLAKPRDGITAYAVKARHVYFVGTLPLLTVKKIHTQHLSVVCHNRDPSSEPASLFFCEV